MVILSVVSAKGGVGKTTLAAGLSLALSRTRKVLAVDLDPQNALRLHLGANAADMDGLARASLQGRPWQSSLFQSNGGGPLVLPHGNLNESDRDALEVHMSSHPEWLGAGLRGLPPGLADVVVLDTPPGPSLYQQQALRAANLVLVVVQADPASYATLPAMETILDRYCTGRDGFFGAHYLLNNVNSGSTLSRDVVRAVRSSLGERVVPIVVHQDEAVREALAFDQSVLQYAPHGEATRDILQVSQWLAQQMGSFAQPRRAGHP